MKFPTEIGLIKPGGLVDPKHMKVMTRFPDHEGVCHHGALAICLNLPGSKWVIAECANGFTNAPYLHSWVKHNGAALTGGRLNADGLIGYYPV
ncbi:MULTISPECIES: hypothetical protein [unclassified Ruegeria]|uniref:hypothetical protein n=1 Tax=unclassified Ruegeria TaxID=2625375 RepID=UPI0014881849|nr:MULTISPECIES: hypothetical protein [unclassified Ruegeria]